MARGEEVKTFDRFAPSLWHLREQPDSKACILGTLGVVRGRGQQRQRTLSGSLDARCVKLLERAGAVGIGPDLVERDQTGVAIEGGVLDALGHHRCGDLLETLTQLAV